MKLGLLLAKDLRLVARNRALVVTLLVYPLLLVSVIGLAFAEPNQRIPVAFSAASEDNGPVEIGGETFSLETITQSLERFAHVVAVSEPEGRELLRNGEVDAVIVLPPGFLQDIVSINRSATVGIVLDLSDPVKASVAENHIRGVLQVFNQALVEEKVEIVVSTLQVAMTGGSFAGEPVLGIEAALSNLRAVRGGGNISVSDQRRLDDTIQFLEQTREGLRRSSEVVRSTALPVRPEVEHVQSGQIVARDIAVPAALALSIFWTGTLAASSLVVYERESKAARRLAVAPVPRGLVTLSKFLLTALLVAGQSALILAAAKAGWNVRIDSPDLLALMVVAATGAALGMGLLVSALVRDTNGATLLSVLVTFPMIFLSGLFFPISFMPEAAQWISRLLPLTYAVDGLRGTMLRDYAPAEALPDLLALGIFTLFLALLGAWASRKRFASE